ncbi:MAG TPA: methionine--tRNA ligase, partial [Candidatus Paceibacterota bacterium]
MPSKIYLTTTLPYVNADPHIGFALEIVTADVLARYYRLLGWPVFFNTGTDEHGEKIYRRALEEKLSPQDYVDIYAQKFVQLKQGLNLSYDYFSRTTDSRHVAAAQEFWRRCAAAGDIYQKQYELKYCVGCELEKTDSELENGYCPTHPQQALEVIAEENYFFRFSKYQNQLLKLYRKPGFQLEAGLPNFVVPPVRLNEVRKFVERGLQDFSISRLKSKMPWGIAVPNDETQVMYVWFDALVNYISGIGWPDELEKFNKWWPVIQFAGKDNLRQQAAMWPAMLMSAGLPPAKQIIVHGFITSNGQKMSKSLGNVINPVKLVEEYGTDAVRYFLTRHTNPFEDTDVTLEKFKEAYNANLANGLGNLVSRVMKLASDYLSMPIVVSRVTLDSKGNPSNFLVGEHIKNYELNQAMDEIWWHIGRHDAYIQETKPFTLIKTDPIAAREIIAKLVQGLADLAVCLEPFMPATAVAIINLIRTNSAPTQPLF